jgi:hypothetical protein
MSSFSDEGRTMSRGRFFRFRRDTRGAAAIEAGLAFPFLVLFGAGLFEYGSLFYNYQLIQTGVRDGGRYLARVADPLAAETAARNLARTGTVDATGTPRIQWWQPGDIQISYRSVPNPIDPVTGRRTYRGADPLTVVRVSTAITYEGLGLLTALGLGPLALNAAHEERHVGQ